MTIVMLRSPKPQATGSRFIGGPEWWPESCPTGEVQWCHETDSEIMKMFGIQTAVDYQSDVSSTDMFLPQPPDAPIGSNQVIKSTDSMCSSEMASEDEKANPNPLCDEDQLEFDVIEFLKAESIPGLNCSSEEGSRFQKWFQTSGEATNDINDAISRLNIVDDQNGSYVNKRITTVSSCGVQQQEFRSLSQTDLHSDSLIRQSIEVGGLTNCPTFDNWHGGGSPHDTIGSIDQQWSSCPVHSAGLKQEYQSSTRPLIQSPDGFAFSNDQLFTRPPNSIGQQPQILEESSIRSSVSNLRRDHDWQIQWHQMCEQPGNTTGSFFELQQMNVSSRASSPCSRLNLSPRFSFRSPHTLGMGQSHAMLQSPVSPSYCMPPPNCNACPPSQSGSVQYPAIHVPPPSAASQFQVPLSMPLPRGGAPHSVSPTLSHVARKNLPPQLNLQPPGLVPRHTLGLPSPVSPGCIGQSPFLGSSQPHSRTPSPIMFSSQPPGNITTPSPIHLGVSNVESLYSVSGGHVSPMLSPRLQLTPPRTGSSSPVMRVPSPQELSNLAQSILQNALIKKQLEEQKERFVRRQQERIKSVHHGGSGYSAQVSYSSAGNAGLSCENVGYYMDQVYLSQVAPGYGKVNKSSNGSTTSLPVFNIVQPADDVTDAVRDTAY